MHFFTSLTTLLLTAFLVDASPLASTAPTKARGLGSGNSNSNYNYNYKKAFSSSHGGGPHHACLNKTGIAALVDGYTYLLEHPGGSAFNTTANTILSATNFTVQSDSILTLSGRPLGQLAYPSKQVYIDTQNLTPPLPVVSTLGVFATCNQISWRWVATGVGSDELEIRGLIVFDVDPVLVQIVTVYSEFNTAAFETDLGA